MKGLDPRVLKLIVDKAHADKLRVAAYVETAADFKHALAAGVDEIAHLPIPRTDFSPTLSAYVISKELAQRAADMKVTVVSTISTRYREMNGMKLYKDEKEKEILLANQKHNLQTLHQQGVKIAIGSDSISGEQPFATSWSIPEKALH
jgi:imidazolonepropionase-like amidohydrolase